MASGFAGQGGGVSTATFSDLGGAVGDIFAGFGQKYKIQGAQIEKQNYLQAAAFSQQEAEFTKQSTAIKQAQSDRELYKALGQTQEGVASAGFTEGGSALDILRESAQQGALTHQVLGQQGLITEAGYQEEAQSYQNMAAAADVAIKADKFAQKADFISGALKGAAAIATLA
jgi:hypothetical protein